MNLLNKIITLLKPNKMEGKLIKVTPQQARLLHKTGSKEWKEVLESENNFGKPFFSQDITERVKTYEDACSETGESPIDVDDMLAKGFTIDEIAYRKLKTVSKALNEGWVPDWKDGNQKKWRPVFIVDKSSPSGFTFDGSAYYYTPAGAGSGSRLKNEKLSNYSGTQFLDLHIALIKNQ